MFGLVGVNDSDKHSSLLQYCKKYYNKKFYIMGPRPLELLRNINLTMLPISLESGTAVFVYMNAIFMMASGGFHKSFKILGWNICTGIILLKVFSVIIKNKKISFLQFH